MRTLYSAFPLGGWVARQHEGGLGKIHLARQGLHVLVAEPASIGKHGQGIALEGARRKNIELHERKAAKFGCHDDFIVASNRSRKSVPISKFRAARDAA